MKRWKKIVIGFAVIAFLTIASSAILWLSGNSNPDFVLPTPSMPEPNAYDYFAWAGHDTESDEQIRTAVTAGNRYPAARSRQILDDHARAIQWAREGLSYEYREPPIRKADQRNWSAYYYQSIGYLFRIEANLFLRKGDTQVAANCYLDAFEIAVMSTRGADFGSYMAAEIMQQDYRKLIAGLIAKMTANSAISVVERLQDILAKHATFADLLQEDKASRQWELLEMFRDRDWAGKLMIEDVMSKIGRVDLDFRIRKFKTIIAGKRRIFAECTEGYDRSIAEANGP